MLSLLFSRAGIAGLVSLALGAVIVALWLDLRWTRSSLADAQQQAATLEAAVRTQNDRIVEMQTAASAAKDAADERARKILLQKKPKPNLRTIEDMNAWLASP